MPHFTIEYSGNLDGVVDFPALVEAVRQAAVATGVFPLAGIRVRTHRADHWAIADGDPAHGFIAMTLAVGEGRDAQTRKAAGEAVFAAMSAALDPAFARVNIALSFEMREIPGAFSWKRNPIHDLLAKGN